MANTRRPTHLVHVLSPLPHLSILPQPRVYSSLPNATADHSPEYQRRRFYAHRNPPSADLAARTYDSSRSPPPRRSRSPKPKRSSSPSLTNRTSGKKNNVAPRGDAALKTQAVNSLLTHATRRNRIDVLIAGSLALTGYQISAMSSDLPHRLRKVLTPAESPAVRVANGGTTAVLAMCTARITISCRPASVLTAVIDHFPHDPILGINILTLHSAIIDCSY